MEIISPVRDLLSKGWGFFQAVLAALVIFIIGWLVAKIIKEAVTRLLRALRVDSISEQVKIEDILAKGGVKYTLSELIGIIIYWIILLGVLISSLNILNLTGVSALLDRVLSYMPNVIGGIIILVLGMYLAAFVASVVRTTTANVGVAQSGLLSKVAQVAIIAFSILIALEELRIGRVLIDAMSIVLASIGLGAALAFGLGCKDIAGKFVGELIDKLKKK
ncbi:MAG: hypothetical protein PHG40_04595 [Candidatus Omnitrophica bacterium]|nr:hypothetical protein [Candidatus Omnitrophota bacterium]